MGRISTVIWVGSLPSEKLMFTVELSVHFVTAGSGWNVATWHAVLGVAVGSIRVQEPSTFL